MFAFCLWSNIRFQSKGYDLGNPDKNQINCWVISRIKERHAKGFWYLTKKHQRCLLCVMNRDPKCRSQVFFAHQELLSAPVMFYPSWWQSAWQGGCIGRLGFPSSVSCATPESRHLQLAFCWVFFLVRVEICVMCMLEVWFCFWPFLLFPPHPVTPTSVLFWVKFFCLSVILIESVGGCWEFHSHSYILETKGPIFALTLWCQVQCVVSLPNHDLCPLGSDSGET